MTGGGCGWWLIWGVNDFIFFFFQIFYINKRLVEKVGGDGDFGVADGKYLRCDIFWWTGTIVEVHFFDIVLVDMKKI